LEAVQPHSWRTSPDPRQTQSYHGKVTILKKKLTIARSGLGVSDSGSVKTSDDVRTEVRQIDDRNPHPSVNHFSHFSKLDLNQTTLTSQELPD
jgi:hypothetical protein